MKLYEMLFVAKNEFAEDYVDSLASEIKEFIKQSGGEIRFSHYFGVRSLAYEIKKNKKGHYYVMHFEVAPSFLEELESKMRLNEDVLRHIIVVIDESNSEEVINMLSIRDKESEDGGAFAADDELIVPVVADKGYRAKAASPGAEDVDLEDESSV